MVFLAQLLFVFEHDMTRLAENFFVTQTICGTFALTCLLAFRG